MKKTFITGLLYLLILNPMFAENIALSANKINKVQGITFFWWIAPISAITALVFASILYFWMLKSSEGNASMKSIANHVREGAMAYLSRQYKTVSIVFLILLIIFAILAYLGIQNPFVPIAFLTGGFFSGLCGFLGMKTATNASARTAQGASESLNRGLQVAFKSGAVEVG